MDPEAWGDNTAVRSERMVKTVGGGSPEIPPSRFAGALGQLLSKRAQAGMLHQLQHRYGNQYVGKVIQAKLKVGAPNDIYEQEA